MLSRVSASNLLSCRFAPSRTIDSGRPCSSDNTLRFVPFFSPISWIWPCCAPSQWCFHHAPVYALPFPADSFQVIVFFQCRRPDSLEKASFFPLLKIPVKAAARAIFYRNRLPLTASPKHIENPRQHFPGIQSFSSLTRTMTVLLVRVTSFRNRYLVLNFLPKLVG